MNAIILAAQPSAALVSAINTLLGYPKAGVDVGGGIHVPPAQSVTTDHTYWWQHPTLSQWAIYCDATLQAAIATLIAQGKLPGGTTAQVIDSTWFVTAVHTP